MSWMTHVVPQGRLGGPPVTRKQAGAALSSFKLQQQALSTPVDSGPPIVHTRLRCFKAATDATSGWWVYRRFFSLVHFFLKKMGLTFRTVFF